MLPRRLCCVYPSSRTFSQHISPSDVQQAATVLSKRAFRTPLLESAALNTLVGGRILVKAENLQKGGSFKYRGAFNRLHQMDAAQKTRGVVAFSSGNFAQGLAAAAQELDVDCTIVMPHDAPETKKAKTAAFGADVVLSRAGPNENRELAADAKAKAISESTGAAHLHPFNDWAVIAGQGTVGIEIAEDAERLGVQLDATLVCTGGGGLSSGVALALSRLVPACQVYTVEPVGYGDWARSLSSGERLGLEGNPRTMCEALQAAMPGEKPFAICSALGVRGLVVEDEAVRRAMGVAFDMLKIVLEPSGAIGLAAVLEGKIDVAGRSVCVIASGGNIDIASYIQIVQP